MGRREPGILGFPGLPASTALLRYGRGGVPRRSREAVTAGFGAAPGLGESNNAGPAECRRNPRPLAAPGSRPGHCTTFSSRASMS